MIPPDPEAPHRPPRSRLALGHLLAAVLLLGMGLVVVRHGADFLMADDPVRFLRENIAHTNTDFDRRAADPEAPFGLYQRLSSINDGLPVGE